MMFTKRLRDRVASGEVTCSIRIWRSARVKAGHRYQTGFGEIEITSIREISLEEISPELARKSGFLGVVDLLKVARHGPGERVFLVVFEFLGPGQG